MIRSSNTDCAVLILLCNSIFTGAPQSYTFGLTKISNNDSLRVVSNLFFTPGKYKLYPKGSDLPYRF